MIANNKGNTHALIKELTIVDKQKGNTIIKKDFIEYVLPHTEKSWDITTTEFIDASQLQINVKPIYASSQV